MKQMILICEGRSEFVYIQRLQSFLDEQSTDWDVPLKFVPGDAGGGSYGKVISRYKTERKDNKRARIEVWVDHDLYLRNDKGNMNQYLRKPSGIPDFRFSYHNFEDFLVLHMDDEKVREWTGCVHSTGHITTPLHTAEYSVMFEKIMPGYRKGGLSPDFISKESLWRLKQNNQKPIIPPSSAPGFTDFATFLINLIDEAFPSLLV